MPVWDRLSEPSRRHQLPALKRKAPAGGRPCGAAWRLVLVAGALWLVAGCGSEEKPRQPTQTTAGPPSVVDIRIVPTPAYATSILTAQVRAVDPEGQLPELLYQWIRNGAEIPGATGQSLRAPEFKRGDDIAVQATPRSRGVQGSAVTSPAITILNSPPAIVRATVTPLAPSRDDTLRVAIEARDPDGDRLVFTYQWLRNGNEIPDARGATLAARDLRKGDRIAVRVTASDLEAETGALESSPVVVRNTPPRVLGGTQWQGGADGTFSYQVSATDPDGDTLTFALSPDAPKGMSVDPQTGVIRWRPGPGDMGSHRFTLTITDGDGGMVRQELSIVVGEK